MRRSVKVKVAEAREQSFEYHEVIGMPEKEGISPVELRPDGPRESGLKVRL